MSNRISMGAMALAGAVIVASGASAQTAEQAEYDANWGLGMINADAANALGFTGAGVTVGALDSGLYVEHPDLINNLADFSYDMNVGGPVTQDYDMHGTHVAGIIAGSRNDFGVRGVAYDSKIAMIVPMTVPDGDEVGLDAGVATVYAQALDAGVRIFNNSWGLNYYTGTLEGQAQLDAVMSLQSAVLKEAVARDSVIVFSTGNELQSQPNTQAGLPHYFPELQPNWIAVTALTRTGEIADYANHCGLAAQWCLAAPGGDGADEEIISTVPLLHGIYGPSSGTSMAAPHVTGAVAVARQMFPNASGAELTRFVLVTATDIGVDGVDDVYGWGLLNMGNMAAARMGLGAELFANAAWAADSGQLALIETLDSRLKTGGARGAWGAALGGWSNHAGTATANEADAETLGLVGGYDFIAGDNLLFGAALSWATTEMDEPGLNNAAKIDSLSLAAYGAAARGSLFVEGSLGGDKRSYDFTRGSLAGAAGTALEASGAAGRSDSDGYGLFADVRAGLNLATRNVDVRPFIRARVTHQSFDGFAETGADVFSLTVEDVGMTRYTAGPGVELRFLPKPLGSAQVSGDVSIQYDTSWGDEDYRIDAGMLGSSVNSQVGELDDAVTVSAGLSADWGRVVGSVRGYYARADDQDAGGLSAGARLTF